MLKPSLTEVILVPVAIPEKREPCARILPSGPTMFGAIGK